MLTALKFFLKPTRLLGLVLAVFCVFWLYNGPEILSRHSNQTESKVIDDFKRSHPTAADWLTEQQDRFGQFNTSVAIQSLQGQSLNPEALKRNAQIRARLIAIYQASDESVLWSHGTAIDAMGDLPEETESYLKGLEAAKSDQDYWSLVHDDPIALSSDLLKLNLELRKDYQANQAWYAAMMEVLVSTLGVTSNANIEEEKATFIELDDLLQVADEGKPYFMQLVPNPNEFPIEACIYFETFRQFGEVIAMAANQGVPAKEVIEVIILNRDAIVSDEDEKQGTKVKDPASIAARLVQLYRNRPSVWSAAQRDGFVLSFDKLTPGLSQRVLEKYPDLGVASLIATQYPDVATPAAAIVDRYGDLGVAVLVQYDGSDNFRKLLANTSIDYRIAMVAVLKSDVGLEAAMSDPAYIDKWIGEDGKPLEEEWWINVPLVGGIAKVAKNYGTGVPSDWGEIGWAAWDVADVGLIIASVGTSKVVTEAAKQGAKRAGKSAAKKMTEAGMMRSVKASVQPSAMARWMAIAKASKAAAPIRWSSRAIISGTRMSKTIGGKLVAGTKRILEVAKRIPPGVRTWAARGLLGASLFVRGPDRIQALVTSMNNFATKLVGDTLDAIPKAIGDAIEYIKTGFASGNLPLLLNLLIVGLSGGFALLFLFDLLPNFSFALASHSGSTVLRKKSVWRKRN